MEPAWVRPAYLYVACLLGVVAMAVGAVVALLGIVHIASPDLQRQGDPVFRAVSTVLDVADAFVAEPGTSEEIPPGVERALDQAREELDRQARDAGINRFLTGVIVFLVGAVVFVLHWRRTERRAAVPQPAGEPPGGTPEP